MGNQTDGSLAGRLDHRQPSRTRYWEDKHADIVESDKLAWSLGWIERHFGPTMLLVNVNDNEIAKMVAKRRGEFNLNRKEPTLISRTTVNLTVINPMRQILRRARKVWKVPVQDIDWSSHYLPEPEELVREATPVEEQAILANLKRGYSGGLFRHPRWCAASGISIWNIRTSIS